ncbi:hypothetical protein [Streptomyces sp. SGAir0957]
MLLLAAICLAGLAPGVATAWLLRGRGWPLAIAAGLGVTLVLPASLIAAMILCPPLGLAVALAAIAEALHAYDDGRIWIATAWAGTAALALACTGVAW